MTLSGRDTSDEIIQELFKLRANICQGLVQLLCILLTQSSFPCISWSSMITDVSGCTKAGSRQPAMPGGTHSSACVN